MVSYYPKKHDYSRYKVVGYPVRHRRKVPFQPMLSLDMETRNMILEIRELDSKLGRFILSADDYFDLVNEAYASNIHWSTKIEGNRLSLDEVRTLTTGYTSGKAMEHNTGPIQEILNHLSPFFLKGRFDLPWTVETIRGVHHLLMNGVGQTEPGKIRDVDVSVNGSDGLEYFIACPKGTVPEELESLVDWVNCSPYGEVITATLFFHEFESIHPFEDGNGRTGRVLFQILLMQSGLRNCNLCMFEQKMLEDKQTYYDLLAYTDSTGVYTPLVMYVTESLLAAYREAIGIFSEKDRLKDMDENMRYLASRARGAGSFTLQDALGWIPMGEPTLRSRLDGLVSMGILEKTGRTRSMRYVFRDPFRDFKERLFGHDNA